jgi:hypothetical protein
MLQCKHGLKPSVESLASKKLDGAGFAVVASARYCLLPGWMLKAASRRLVLTSVFSYD